MGIEFKLGRKDHKKIEDFLGRRPGGVDAISVDAHLMRYQAGAAEAARAAGVDVVVEPLTERLSEIGFEPDGLPYFDGDPLDLALLARSPGARRRLVEEVLSIQDDFATALVPPHFYVHDDASAELNMQLANSAVELAGEDPVRAILVVRRLFASGAADRLAASYADIGVTAIDLRVTPFGGEDESGQKIRSVFTVADAFRAVGLQVTLGCSGNIGQIGLALGHVSGFSVGVGMRESFNHVAAIGRQKRPVDDEEGPRFGPQAGVYLPGLAATVPRTLAQALLADRAIRTRVGCRIGSCSDDIAGPAADPRAHYLHARAHEVELLESRPVPWRPTMEHDRLQRACDLRQIVNTHHLPTETPPLKTRTLRSLLDDIEYEQRMSA